MDGSTEIRLEGARRDGFAGQRMLTLPTPTIRAALSRPVTGRLFVTDAGFFPRAALHGRSRPAGAAQHIVLICTDGEGWCRTPAGKVAVRRGDAVVLPASAPHAYGASLDSPWTVWWLHVVGSDSPELVGECHAASGGVITHLRDPGPLASLVSQTIDALDLGTTGGLIRASGSAWNLMAQLIATGRRPQGNAHNPVEQAVDHLRATSPARTSVESLAAMVGLSTSHLTALFKEQVGVSPLRYQSDLRMARARELLDATALSINAVARDCGYEDPLYFSKQFSKYHHTSPSSYRTRGR